MSQSDAAEYKLSWKFLFIVTTFHALALVGGVYFFSWPALVVYGVKILIAGLGVTFCGHRLLAHGSFQVAGWVLVPALMCFCLALEMTPLFWSAIHRCHHQHSDKDGDPHSPILVNFMWAHINWMIWKGKVVRDPRLIDRYVPDLRKDPVVEFFSNAWVYLSIQVVHFGGLYLLGWWLYGSASMGLSFLMWGGFLAVVTVWNFTWLINSATHLVGGREFETTDESRNSALIAIPTYGEGWHNNHHAYQRAANNGWFRWYQFDLTFLVIYVLGVIGGAKNVTVIRFKHNWVMTTLRWVARVVLRRKEGLVKILDEKKGLIREVWFCTNNGSGTLTRAA